MSHVAARVLEGLLTETGRLVMPHMDRGSPNFWCDQLAMLTWRLLLAQLSLLRAASCSNVVRRSAGCCVPAPPADCAASCCSTTHTTSAARPAFRAAEVHQFFLCMIF